MVESQRRVLEAYGTRFDRWAHEQRDVRDAGRPREVIDALTAAGHTYEQDGALWFRSTAFGDDKDRVLRKSDGELTYFAVDIGFHHFEKFRGSTTSSTSWAPIITATSRACGPRCRRSATRPSAST